MTEIVRVLLLMITGMELVVGYEKTQWCSPGHIELDAFMYALICLGVAELLRKTG